ncbi:MAG: apolipoprotein N-acyltransferase [Elusimicrobia bacterium]|nr:apolipoprotein N-acyltransferase [Elusimicrobiota bacterium]
MGFDILLVMLCGALTGLALPRSSLCLVAWFSLAPLFAAWRRSKSWRGAAVLGFCAGFGFHATVLYWIYDTCRFAGLPVPVGLIAWGALAAFMGLNWALIGALGQRFAEGRGAWRPWAWAALWTAVAFFCERWTPRLCTDLLEYTQGRHLALLQVSSLAGPHFLGFLIVAANAVLEQAWAESGGRPRQAATASNLAVVLALLAGSWGYGVFELARRDAEARGPAARVEFLQPAVDQYEKFDAQHARDIIANFDELLSRPRTAPPVLVIWPETCLPYVVVGKGLLEPAAWGRKLGAWQIVGAVSQIGADMRNSAFLLAPSGEEAGVYHKRQLVPFGEFQPFPFLGRFIGLLNQLGGLTAGSPEQAFFDTPLGLIAGSICYEAMFPRLARADAGRGARLVVNVTNDGWYKDTWGPYQHFEVNLCRAIENRVTVLRGGNTGISGVIDPWGVVTARLDLNERGRLDAEVPLADPFPRRSFYARHGDWFGALCLLAAAGLVVLGLRQGHKGIS